MNLKSRTIRFLFRKLGLNFLENVRKEQKKLFRILTKDESNSFYKQAIESKLPQMLSRLGSPEANCLLNWMQVKSFDNAGITRHNISIFEGKSQIWVDQVKDDLFNLVGFFPIEDQALRKFSSIYSEKIQSIDGICIWGFVPGENYLIKKFCPSAIRINPEVLDPFFFESPWTAKLRGKKVLVIHPFTESIESQYKKREKLFKNRDTLPEFGLKTIKAVQSIAGTKTSFSTWFEALDYMKSEINKIDFDIALIAAGSYGIPLSAHVKELGKCAIHMGGTLQILFGIKGQRWDDHPPTAALYNEHWVRPSVKETVKNASIVEGACYW